MSTTSAPIRQRRASAYRAGPTLDDALAAGRRLAERGLASTVGYSAAPGRGAGAVADAHVAAFERLAGEEPTATSRSSCRRSRSTRGCSPSSVRPRRERAGGCTSTRSHRRRSSRPGGCSKAPPAAPARHDAARALAPQRRRRVARRRARPGRPGRQGPVARPRRRGRRSAAGFLQVVDRLARSPGDRRRGDARRPAAHRGAAADSCPPGTPCEVELFYGLPFRAPALAARRRGVSGSHLRPVRPRRRAVRRRRPARTRPQRGGSSRTCCSGRRRHGGASNGRRCAPDPRRAGRRFDPVRQLGLRAAVVARRRGARAMGRGDRAPRRRGRRPTAVRASAEARARDDRPAAASRRRSVPWLAPTDGQVRAAARDREEAARRADRRCCRRSTSSARASRPRSRTGCRSTGPASRRPSATRTASRTCRTSIASAASSRSTSGAGSARRSAPWRSSTTSRSRSCCG